MTLRKLFAPLLAAPCVLLTAPPAPAQSSLKISQMPAAGALAGTEPIPTVQGGANVATTPAAIKTYVGAQTAWFPAYVPGNWYAPPFVSVAAGAVINANTIYCAEQVNLLPMSVQAVAARVTTAGTTNFQLAIYANSGGFPNGAPLATTANIADTGVGLVSSAPSGGAFTLPAGAYWSCVNVGDATAVFQANANATVAAAAFAGTATLSNLGSSATNIGLRLSMTQTFGTWPTVSSAGWSIGATAIAPIIYLQSN